LYINERWRKNYFDATKLPEKTELIPDSVEEDNNSEEK